MAASLFTFAEKFVSSAVEAVNRQMDTDLRAALLVFGLSSADAVLMHDEESLCGPVIGFADGDRLVAEPYRLVVADKRLFGTAGNTEPVPIDRTCTAREFQGRLITVALLDDDQAAKVPEWFRDVTGAGAPGPGTRRG
jgi:hypothetical protein